MPFPLFISAPMPTAALIAYGIFFFVLGACVGSFLNVVIWRLPYHGREITYQGQAGKLTLSWPPSHCPLCDASIHWYQNIPILSWILLRARCANCKATIPVRYPLVELGTGCAFFALYLGYFVAHWRAGFVDLGHDWPAYILHVFMIACLLAASAIDADLFIIPLSIPWLLLIVTLVASPFIDNPAIPYVTPTGGWSRVAIGGLVGLLLANALLWLKLLPRSFSEQVLAQHSPPTGAAPETLVVQTESGPVAIQPDTPNLTQDILTPPAAASQTAMPPPPKLTRFSISVTTAGALLLAAILCWLLLSPLVASLVALIVAILIFLLGVLPRDAGQTDVTDEVMEEISADYVRAEVAKEGLFLFLAMGCALLAYFVPFHLPPLPWLGRLLGVLLGALAGGGILWFIRVAGTMAFNKEAMGRGDVDLLMAIGAVVGGPLVILTFFLAPVIALLWVIVIKILGKPHVLPYGPWLSVAAILALLIGIPILNAYLATLGLPPLATPPGGFLASPFNPATIFPSL